MLTGKRSDFARHYARLKNGTKAALEAKYAPRSAHNTAALLLKNGDVLDAIAHHEAELREAALLTQTDITRMWKEAATADRNDLMEVRRTCCRYCFGTDHLYQETPAEYRARSDAHQMLLKMTPEKEWKRIPEFSELGGHKFDRRKDPHPDCPECFGDGDMLVVIKDTRKLPKGARALYEGVKITNSGIELKVMDRGKAIENLANTLGMLGKQSHVHMNPDGTPLELKPLAIQFVAVSVKTGEG